MSRGMQTEAMILPVLSGSMLPYLCPGGKVCVQNTPAHKCHLGDIIVFKESERLIAHRVLLRLRIGRRLYLYQKGDAAGVGHWVRGDDILGVVVCSTDVDGAYLYLREGHDTADRRGIYLHLWRDLVTRARMTVKALAVRTGFRRSHG